LMLLIYESGTLVAAAPPPTLCTPAGKLKQESNIIKIN